MMHSIHSGGLLKRLRIQMFGLSLKELRDNYDEFLKIRAQAMRDQELEDAEDELRYVQEYSEQEIMELERLFLVLPSEGDRMAMLQARFGSDYYRVLPYFNRKKGEIV